VSGGERRCSETHGFFRKPSESFFFNFRRLFVFFAAAQQINRKRKNIRPTPAKSRLQKNSKNPADKIPEHGFEGWNSFCIRDDFAV